MLSVDELDVLRRMPAPELSSLLGELIDTNREIAVELIAQLQEPGEQASLQADKRGVSQHFGVSIKTIEAWQLRGMPYESQGAGLPVSFDLAASAKWLAAQKLVASNRSPEEAEQARRYREEKTKLAELQRKKAEGKLVDREEVTMLVLQAVNAIKTGVKNWHVKFGDDAAETLTQLCERVSEQFDRDVKRQFGPVTHEVSTKDDKVEVED